ncbi:MAG: helix-turn-helix transcriptional regulator [Oscillospiraceae bacterium]|nr:helix-turn-helix transcriptional regulator [Oscillospiraceae bacterium]
MTFYDRLHALCKEKNITLSKMLNELGLSTGSTGNWKKGQLPKGDVLKKIADYLNTSIDYIVYGEFRSNLSDDEKSLLKIYNQTPERAKYKVLCDFTLIVDTEIAKYAKEMQDKKD